MTTFQTALAGAGNTLGILVPEEIVLDTRTRRVEAVISSLG